MGWPGRAQQLICWSVVGRRKAQGACDAHISEDTRNHHTIGIDVGKNTFHLVGLDKRGAIVLQQKVTRHRLWVDPAPETVGSANSAAETDCMAH